jgi:uncharacterized protein (DUF488 family)
VGDAEIWTVGHSTHEMPAFVALLRQHRIEVVADVRTYPSSRHNPQFNRKSLQSSLLDADIRYVFLGKELGGRPPEPEFYDAKGHVRYSELAKSGRFAAGRDRLLNGSSTYRVAILCSEESPERCHRRMLITPVLTERGINVKHIRGDGSVVSEADLARLPEETAQGALFGTKTWPDLRCAAGYSHDTS